LGGRVGEFGVVAHAGGLDGGGELIEDDGFAKERKLIPV
jgi:hypothetical protein